MKLTRLPTPQTSSKNTMPLSAAAPTASAMVHGTGNRRRQMLPSIHATAKVKKEPNKMEGRIGKQSL
jgi:hypothetical protein